MNEEVSEQEGIEGGTNEEKERNEMHNLIENVLIKKNGGINWITEEKNKNERKEDTKNLSQRKIEDGQGWKRYFDVHKENDNLIDSGYLWERTSASM